MIVMKAMAIGGLVVTALPLVLCIGVMFAAVLCVAGLLWVWETCWSVAFGCSWLRVR